MNTKVYCPLKSFYSERPKREGSSNFPDAFELQEALPLAEIYKHLLKECLRAYREYIIK